MSLTEEEILDELERLGIRSDPEIDSCLNEYQEYCSEKGFNVK
jgi:hypothetical protein